MLKKMLILLVTLLFITNGTGFCEEGIIVQFNPEVMSAKDITKDLIQKIVPKHKLSKVERLVSDEIVQRIKFRKKLECNIPDKELKKDEQLMSNLVLLKFPKLTKEQREEILDQLNMDDRVKYAEIDRIVEIEDTIPDDPEFDDQDYMSIIKAPQAWDVTQGSNDVIVAVIDTGIDLDHEDLQANICTDPDEKGYDYLNNDDCPNDDNGHGTNVAGIIGAVGDNGLGIAGLSWHVKLMPLKFMGPDKKGSISDAIKCINYAVANGAHIINASYGYYDVANQTERSAIKHAMDFGILFIASAGNAGSNNDTVSHYPSNYELDNIIAVSAVNLLDNLDAQSNYGVNKVDLGAPGVNVRTTNNIISSSTDPYEYASGTSIAAPHVSGTAALIKALHPTWTYYHIKAAILSSVDTVASLSGKVSTGGRLNVNSAVSWNPPVYTDDDSVEMYRYLSYVCYEHLFKIEKKTPSGYIYEGIKFRVLPDLASGAVPLYRFFSYVTGDHFYKTDSVTPSGYIYEGIECYVYPNLKSGTVALHRYYNPANGDHHYKTEKKTPLGYVYEGIKCYVYPK